MNKLETKHLAPYLPYGLKHQIKFDGDNCYELLRGIKHHRAYIGGSKVDVKPFSFEINELPDPILYPLSDLTKPIWHEGEEFVPIHKINKYRKLNSGYHSSSGFEYDYESLCDREISKDLSITGGGSWEGGDEEIDIVQFFNVQEKLYEWKLDIHGLIEKGLAIDVNSLDTNPYK